MVNININIRHSIPETNFPSGLYRNRRGNVTLRITNVGGDVRECEVIHHHCLPRGFKFNDDIETLQQFGYERVVY